MASKSKLTDCIPTHLTRDSANAVKNFAFDEDATPSQWVRRLIDDEINRRRLQAQSTLAATACLANDANETNDFEDEE